MENPIGSRETLNISCRTNPISLTGVKKVHFLEDEANHPRLPSGLQQGHPSWRLKFRLWKITLRLHKPADEGTSFLGVSPIGNFSLIEPGSSSRFFLMVDGEGYRGRLHGWRSFWWRPPTVPWPNPIPCVNGETWTAGMIVEILAPYWEGKSVDFRSDEAIYSSHRIDLPHPSR